MLKDGRALRTIVQRRRPDITSGSRGPWGGRTLRAPNFFSKSCRFQEIEREHPILSKFWAQGSKFRWAPLTKILDLPLDILCQMEKLEVRHTPVHSLLSILASRILPSRLVQRG